jgi:(p)ppGpp synthase/HD superfamily hydrolase
VGYLTKNNGVTVHSHDCHTVSGLATEKLIDVSWNLDGETESTTDVFVRVCHSEHPSAIPQIINAVTSAKATITEFRTDPNDIHILHLRMALVDYEHFLFVMNSMRGLKPLVTSVERYHPYDHIEPLS